MDIYGFPFTYFLGVRKKRPKCHETFPVCQKHKKSIGNLHMLHKKWKTLARNAVFVNTFFGSIKAQTIKAIITERHMRWLGDVLCMNTLHLPRQSFISETKENIKMVNNLPENAHESGDRYPECRWFRFLT